MDDIKVKLSEDFGEEMLNLADYLEKRRVNLAIITQILKSGTSIGANISESLFGESRVDFIHKLKISQKEASETRYWLRILYRAGKIEEGYYKDLINKCDTLLKVITAVIKTSSKD